MVEITRDPLDVLALIARVQSGADGAVTSFIGVVRDHARGRDVLQLEYHAYEPMALRLLQQIREEAEEKWQVCAGVAHRLGCLQVGEPSVVIVVASPHRAEAFAACRHIIERIKAEAPIWKREHYADGAVWIEEEGGGCCGPGAGVPTVGEGTVVPSLR